MTDQYQWWRDALAGKNPLINANEPQSGYYRMRYGKDKPWLPVAIWSQSGTVHCRVGPENRDAHNVWTWCAANPVGKAEAAQAFETGAWPGDVAIGHNSGELSLAEEIEDASATALTWLSSVGIKDQTTNDIAANHKQRIWDLHKRAKAERDEQKAPHEQKCDEIDGVYKPLINKSRDAYDVLGAALTRYMVAEKERANKAAAEVARIENERRMAEFRRQQEEAAATAKAKGDDPVIATLDTPIPTFVAPAPVRISAGGQRGKKVGLRENTKYRMIDYAAALAHVKDHPDVIAAVSVVACKQARAGATVPGVESYIEEIAI